MGRPHETRKPFRDWLYQNTSGRSGRGFWLGRYLLDGVDTDQKWQVANHQAIADYLTVTQCLVLTFNLWPEYENWALANGLDRRRGIGHGRNAVEKGVLPPKRIINLTFWVVNSLLKKAGITIIGT